jgi:spore coat polysaccharide biosynthesis predicted glycosyltransferase SpsG
MRVIVWTKGGDSAGVGHLTRCQALIPALARRGASIRVFVEADESLAPFIEVDGIETHFAADHQSSFSAVNQALPIPLLIADRPDLTAEDSKTFRAAGARKLALLAGSRIGYYPSDLAIIDDPILTETQKPLARRFEVGVHLHMIRPEILALRPNHAEDVEVREPIRLLIALSGTDPGGITEALVSSLRDRISYENENLQLILRVVAGPGWSDQRLASLLKEARGCFEVVTAPNNLGEEILKSDAVITLGGRITYEAFALGRPVMCIPWSTTRIYATALDKQRLALLLDSDPKKAAEEIVNSLKEPVEIVERARRAFLLINNSAADEVAELCLDGVR